MVILGPNHHYHKILQLVNDNTDGRAGAFSIQNVVRMSLIYDKFPCEWHGPNSISLVMQALNNVYQPFEDFKVVLF